jgi:RimJ/RimL family protein N-acetyltransferase
MLRGEHVGLRARHAKDVPILETELYGDVVTRSRGSGRPWIPISPDTSASPYAIADPRDTVAEFSVVRLSDGELVGEAGLWGIDLHNRNGHPGLSLRPDLRGKGHGVDVVRVLCTYGFAVRGLHRLQIETLADNTAMIRTAVAAGFVIEGTLRSGAWAAGTFVDEVILGLLADEWTQPE